VSGERTVYSLEGMAVPESIDLLQDLIEAVRVDHPDVGGQDLGLFETAVVEIAGNLAEHGHRAGGAPYKFRLEVHPDRLAGTLTDEGPPLPEWPPVPVADPDPLAESGRGLALAGAVLDTLSYERREGLNAWLMVRNRR